MVSSQHGREFTGSHYEKIKKVYSIWICMNPPKNRENTITRYRLVEEHLVGEAAEPVQHYDLLSVIMICLGSPDAENYDGVLRMLDVLLGSETGEAEKRKILQDEYGIQMTQALERKVSVMCNLSKGVIEKSLAKGIAQGLAQGRTEGRAEGMADGISASIKNLVKNMGVSIEQAMSILEVPEAERQKYMNLLEKQ